MEEFYALLGIHPTTPADGIEEAYQNKKRESSPESFVQGSEEWSNAVAMQDKLKKAYDAAMMATFAPIRALSPSSETPRLHTPETSQFPSVSVSSAPSPVHGGTLPQPFADPFLRSPSAEESEFEVFRPSASDGINRHSPQENSGGESSAFAAPARPASPGQTEYPVRQASPETGFQSPLPAGSNFASSAGTASHGFSVPHLSGPNPSSLPGTSMPSAAPKPAENLSAARSSSSPGPEIIRSEYRPSSSSSVGAEVRDLVEEVPVSFSDEQLMSMNIDELRSSLHSQGERKKGLLPTLGIEDPLLRTYVWGYIAFVLVDLMMRFAFAGIWDNLSLFLRRFGAEVGIDKLSPLASVTASFVSIFYVFVCSLIMPILVRFFVVRQPVEKTRTRLLLSALAVIMGLAFYTVTGFLFRILPPAWAGSSGNIFWIAPWLCQRTLKYGGR